jgi:hypothetical protein
MGVGFCFYCKNRKLCEFKVWSIEPSKISTIKNPCVEIIKGLCLKCNAPMANIRPNKYYLQWEKRIKKVHIELLEKHSALNHLLSLQTNVREFAIPDLFSIIFNTKC